MNPRAPDFPGFTAPTTDFGAVIDGRRSPPLIYELDLSVARSYGANSAVQLRLTGNSFYIDQAPDVGNAYVVFEGVQDNTGPLIRPAIYVQPGFVSRVPFANLWIANAAQAGKVLRIIYGTDIDFLPSLNGQISISGSVNSTPYGYSYGGSYESITALAANTPDTVFAAGANTNGAIIWTASAAGRNASTQAALIAKTSAPATVIDGDVLTRQAGVPGFAAGDYAITLNDPVFVAAGKGAYFIATGADTICAGRSALYTLL
jgi:hypothetical protein